MKEELVGNVKNEWANLVEYYSKKSKQERFNVFKKKYNNFEGDSFEEFNNMNCVGFLDKATTIRY
jgi:hypothetical protein